MSQTWPKKNPSADIKKLIFFILMLINAKSAKLVYVNLATPTKRQSSQGVENDKINKKRWKKASQIA